MLPPTVTCIFQWLAVQNLQVILFLLPFFRFLGKPIVDTLGRWLLYKMGNIKALKMMSYYSHLKDYPLPFPLYFHHTNNYSEVSKLKFSLETVLPPVL